LLAVIAGSDGQGEADGGLMAMASKPYIASGKYIQRIESRLDI
jgi:deoxyribodipyrimidine photolyase-like uncharacterized protein